jgi:transposase
LEDPDHPQRPEPARAAGDHDIEEATDGDIFLAYVEPVLGPALHVGDVVVRDNLSAHKVRGVRELIQAAGAELLYLSPYSPDLNPIELAWAKLKPRLSLASPQTFSSDIEALARGGSRAELDTTSWPGQL